TAVSVACLTLFDMLKAADKGMTIGEIRVTEKEGGASGDWQLPR
ncbi:MAG TPA: cyclic pyranopterin monophosphate synthase MoaC, partial [Erythrobacter sp.]|nr:cyclic pyranopterin monophosphate synthase MoaC [Erythrobacter sp.]